MSAYPRTPSGSRSGSALATQEDNDIDIDDDSPENEDSSSGDVPEPETSRQRHNSSSSWSSDPASGPETEDEEAEPEVDYEMMDEQDRHHVQGSMIRPASSPFSKHRPSHSQSNTRPSISVPKIINQLSDDEPEVEKKASSLTTISKETCKLMVDYLISEGFREVAEALCNEAGLVLPISELQLLDSRVAIRNAIVGGQLEEAINLVNSTCPSLIDQNGDVRFHLHQQNILEMIRTGQVEKVLVYAEQHLSRDSKMNDDQLDRLEKTFALLAFEDPIDSPFAHLLSESHRQMVSTEVNSAVLRYQNRPDAPRLEALLRMIVWAEKQILEKTNHPDALLSTKTLAKQLFDNAI